MTYKVFGVVALVGLSVLGFGCKKWEATFTNGADQMVRNISIKPGDKLGPSPLKVTGEAKGNYYFEASFPIKLEDANGKLLGAHLGKAQADWMTENFVPFEAEFSYAPATTTSGWLILERDNPSGEPQNDASYRIPVQF